MEEEKPMDANKPKKFLSNIASQLRRSELPVIAFY